MLRRRNAHRHEGDLANDIQGKSHTMHKCWLLLEKSDETRISKGIDAYHDATGSRYHYDSLVPNHKNLATNDIVLIRKEDQIVGWGVIGPIATSESVKTHRRCPECSVTDIRERKTKTPKWKCGKCAKEFPTPTETQTAVRSYVATIQDFKLFGDPPDVKAVKRCAIAEDGEKSQLSMIELQSDRISDLLGSDQGDEPPFNESATTRGQGFGLSSEQRKAVELQAMEIAINFYERDGWVVTDRSKRNPFDLLATRDGQRRFIEVKGTTGDGSTVILTTGEVSHAREHPAETVIFVVAFISLSNQSGSWRAFGGRVIVHHDPWCPAAERLTPTVFRYEFPQ